MLQEVKEEVKRRVRPEIERKRSNISDTSWLLCVVVFSEINIWMGRDGNVVLNIPG